MRPNDNRVARKRRGVIALATAALLVAGCGSSGPEAGKQARIAAALRHLENELRVGQQEPPWRRHGWNALGTLTLVYAPPPKGVSQAEWNTAIKHDRALQRLMKDNEETAPPRGPPG
ncbi:MAG: hypothetical protein QOK19_2129 [Solirubrobacteraceae bacterium]|jgi:hypothetical protein|nr:hypothetical protein [Solirubrobacteraceae bacterium]